jgi:hypothetical protein
MARIIWQRQGLSWDEVCRRAGARRRWNERRRAAQQQRQHEVWCLLCRWGTWRGVQRAIAEQLGVHPSVISRDVAMLRRGGAWW